MARASATVGGDGEPSLRACGSPCSTASPAPCSPRLLTPGRPGLRCASASARTSSPLVGTLGVCVGALVLLPPRRLPPGHRGDQRVRARRPVDGIMARARSGPARGAPSSTRPSTGSGDAAVFGGLVLYFAGRRGRDRRAVAGCSPWRCLPGARRPRLLRPGPGRGPGHDGRRRARRAGRPARRRAARDRARRPGLASGSACRGRPARRPRRCSRWPARSTVVPADGRRPRPAARRDRGRGRTMPDARCRCGPTGWAGALVRAMPERLAYLSSR